LKEFHGFYALVRLCIFSAALCVSLRPPR
jgi:hypothetical protein